MIQDNCAFSFLVYWLWATKWTTGDRSLGKSKYLYIVHTGCGDHSASYLVDAWMSARLLRAKGSDHVSCDFSDCLCGTLPPACSIGTGLSVLQKRLVQCFGCRQLVCNLLCYLFFCILLMLVILAPFQDTCSTAQCAPFSSHLTVG